MEFEPIQTDRGRGEPFVEKIFDPYIYGHMYHDLRSTDDLWWHFKAYGLTEGRAPSLMFDVPYVRRWIAVAHDTELLDKEALSYFLTLPKAQRFVPNRLFSAWAFRLLYTDRFPDVASMSDYELFEFYLEHHSHKALSPNGVFNEKRYRLRHPDIADAIAEGKLKSAFVHFLLYGAAEGRGNLPNKGGSNGIESRWLMGGQVGLDPIARWFDPTFYLLVYPDVQELVRGGTVKSALEHYMVAGFREGRLPFPGAFRSPAGETETSPWDYLSRLEDHVDEIDRSLSINEASAILSHLKRADIAFDRVRAMEALWPHIVPKIGGTFDTERYLAVNADVAEAVRTTSLSAEAHWRTTGLFESRVAPGTNLFGDRALAFQDMLDWKSGVNFFGPVHTSSGLGSAARGYVAALKAAGIAVDVYDTAFLIHGGLPVELVCCDDLRYSINFFCINVDLIVPLVRRYGTDIFKRRANVGAWVWELSSPRPEWRSALSAFDLIVTPSDFCSRSFSLFTDRPVRTIPYVVEEAELTRARDAAGPNVFVSMIEKEKSRGRKIVLFVMDASSYTERKGVDLFCQLAQEVDRKHPGRFLFVLKSHSRDLSKSQAVRYDTSIFNVHGILDFATLCRLKSLADLYVSPHRSEGFGLNIFESILLGVPVLCSDYAGGTDLLVDAEPPLVPVRPCEVQRDMGPYLTHAIWAEPTLPDLEAALLRFFEAGPSKKFSDLRQRIIKTLSVASVGARMKEELQRWCAFGAEEASDRLRAFDVVATREQNECFAVNFASDSSRRSRETPGIERLGEIAMHALRPMFSIITPCFNTLPQWLRELYDDLLQQHNLSWEWCLCDDGSTRSDTLACLRELRRGDARIKVHFNEKNQGISGATNTAVGFASGKYIVMVDHDDRIAPTLLSTYYHVAETHCRSDGDEILLYCDEDKIDVKGNHCDTYYKPDWSPEHLTSVMYVLHCLCVRKTAFLRLGGYRPAFDSAQDFDFLLRAAAGGVPIQHVDQLLYHWRMSATSAAMSMTAKGHAIETGRRAVVDYLDRVGIAGTVDHGLLPGTYRPRPTPRPGKIALNILTRCTPKPVAPARLSRRDNGLAADASAFDAEPSSVDEKHETHGLVPSDTYVAAFVRSILAFPPKLDFEIRLVVDEGKVDVATPLQALDARVKVVPFRRSGASFNFAEKANFALGGCQTERMVLLNDDMEAIDDQWLTALVEMLELPGVGIVGGELLFADDTIQHSGIVLGTVAPAAHLFYGEDSKLPCYNSFNKVIRNYSAVTGAMMAMERSSFDQIGGFNLQFPIDYNDIDFCLKAAQLGLRTVYTPFAKLRHFESRSAHRLAADDLDSYRFAKRWAAQIARDPYYNRHFARTSARCEVVDGSEGRNASVAAFGEV